MTTVRRYEQRLRAESAVETRRRILDSFADQLRAAPTEPVSLDQVAKRARVARSTIYTVFGSRTRLFDAFVDDLWARTGLGSLTAAVQNPDARLHLRNGIATAARMFAADLSIYRVLFSLGRLDPEAVGGAIAKIEDDRAGGMGHLARRLQEDRLLRSDVSVEQATDLLWVFCSFESFDALYSVRGLSLEAAVELIITMAERSLLDESADS